MSVSGFLQLWRRVLSSCKMLMINVSQKPDSETSVEKAETQCQSKT